MSACLCNWSGEAPDPVQLPCEMYEATGVETEETAAELLFGSISVSRWMKSFGFLCDLCLHGLLIEIRASLAFLPTKNIGPLGLFSEAEKGNLAVAVSWSLLVMCPPRMLCGNPFGRTLYQLC